MGVNIQQQYKTHIQKSTSDDLSVLSVRLHKQIIQCDSIRVAQSVEVLDLVVRFFPSHTPSGVRAPMKVVIFLGVCNYLFHSLLIHGKKMALFFIHNGYFSYIRSLLWQGNSIAISALMSLLQQTSV